MELCDIRLDSESVRKLFSDCDIVVEAVDGAETKVMILSALLPSGKPLVTASGMAGWGRSNAMRVRRMGRSLIAVGDGESAVDGGQSPQSPRVGLAAALQANAVVALLLGQEP